MCDRRIRVQKVALALALVIFGFTASFGQAPYAVSRDASPIR